MLVEGRALGQNRSWKGNVIRPTESRISTETKLKIIAWLSARDESKVFNNLMYLFNKESFKACFNELDGRKEVGVNGVDKAKYGKELDANLDELIERMKQMFYRPLAVTRIFHG